jgi:homoaconitase/3-isopropylmalate dehydratase large subunit
MQILVPILGNEEHGGVMGKTLAEKIWADHIVSSAANEPDLLYIDLHLMQEVTRNKE